MNPEKDFHFNITHLNHQEIRDHLRNLGFVFDSSIWNLPPRYKVSHCCAVHCEEVFMYSGKNPGYCEIHLKKKRHMMNEMVGVPYGQSKL